MPEIIIEQALYHRPDNEEPRLVARSPGFADEWLAEAEDLARGFGDRPAGMKCPAAVFAHLLGVDRVAVVHVADLPGVQQACFGFYFLIMPQSAYEGFGGDPFALGRRLPPDWNTTTLSSCSLPAQPLPARTVADIRHVLKRIKAGALPEDRDPEEEPERTVENSESPALLGGAQVLVDGGRVVFERPGADTGLIPDLWLLLPTTTRNRLWPASYCFGNALAFDALVVPRARGEDYEGYTSEEQAAEYPAGKYEYDLQVAVEHGDQNELDRLLSRRSLADTWRLGLTLLVLVMLLAIGARVLDVLSPPAPTPPPQTPDAKITKDKAKP